MGKAVLFRAAREGRNAVVIIGAAGQAPGQAAALAANIGTCRTVAIEAFEGKAAFQRLAGRMAGDADHAAQGARTPKGRQRSAQDFDAVGVPRGQQTEIGAAADLGRVVEADAVEQIKGMVGAGAADRGSGGFTRSTIVRHAQVGRVCEQVGDEQGLIGFNVGGGQDVDRLAEFRHRQAFAGDGDDDFSGLFGVEAGGKSQQGGGEEEGGFQHGNGLSVRDESRADTKVRSRQADKTSSLG